MTALEQLNAYFGTLERRFRLLVLSRGAALAAGGALLLTVVFAWVGDRFAFAEGAVLPLRILLYASVAAAIVLLLIIPVRRLTRLWVARQIEHRAPGFEQRLLTLTERQDADNPFHELLAQDSLSVASAYTPEDLAPNRVVLGAAASAAVAAAVLLWLILAAPGFLGYGASMLWAGVPRSSIGPLYKIDVSPGDKTVRRKSDQLITARLSGFSPDIVKLHVKYKDSLKWEEAPMQPQPGVNSYGFLIAGLADSLDYYVEAGRASSRHFHLTAKDIAGVTRVKTVIQPPSWLGLQQVVNDPGGDIRAVEGSTAKVSVLTDRPLDRGVLVFEDGQQAPLQHEQGNWLSASLKVTKDSSYHVAAVDSGELVRISEDYFIEAKRDEAPSVRLSRLDSRVSPIEELPVAVEASDDFGLRSLELHYSVNGGPDQKVPLLKSGAGKQADGKTLLYLEDFHLVPGDLVSMYAEAKDARQTSRTDIAFVQAEPFDLTFRQSQQSGGGGGGGQGNESEQISEKQKEVIAATWNQSRDTSHAPQNVTENARFLSEMENKIGEQAKTLADRMRSRELSAAGSKFADFSKEMDKASEEIVKASAQLKRQQFEAALAPEERALQSFLRADAMFRDIEVAFGRQGGGGGGQGSAGRDLARMLDLELDTEKNQYETGESQSSADTGAQKQVDEMLQRLKMLAARQQDLAAQRQMPEHAFEQRYQEEMLRREAEQLQRQLEQMQNSARQQSSLQRQGQQGGESGSSSSGGQSGQQGSSSRGSRQGAAGGGSSSGSSGSSPMNASARQAMQQAMDALRQAEDEMRKAVTEHDAAAMRRAGDKLAEAQGLMAGIEKQMAGNSVSDVAGRARQLAHDQSDFANRLDKAFPGEGAPGFTPFSDRPRRRFAPEPFQRPATPQMNALANEKERIAQQLAQLEQQIHDRANALEGGQPDVAHQMRKALSEAEQQDLELHMKKNAEWIRRGWGMQVKEDESAMAGSLSDLADQLAKAQAGVKEGDQPGAGNPQTAQAERTLRQLEGLRQELERQAAQASPGGNRGSQAGDGTGQLSRSQQQGGSGNPSGSQGSQVGGEGAQGGAPRSEGRTGEYAEGPRVGGGMLGLPQQPGDYGNRPADRAFDPRAVDNALRQLNGLRPRDTRGSYGAAWNDLYGVLRDLQSLGQADPALLAARLNQEVLPALERLEVELKRQAGNDSAHTTKADPAPAEYREAVAEYFRRLSK